MELSGSPVICPHGTHNNANGCCRDEGRVGHITVTAL